MDRPMVNYESQQYDPAADDRWMTEREIIATQVDAALYAVAAALDAFAALPGDAGAEQRRAAIMERRAEVTGLVAERAAERRERDHQDQAPAPEPGGGAAPTWRQRLWG